jgi:hypothetical protein
MDGFFLITGGDPAVVLELTEQALDHMPLLIMPPKSCKQALEKP